MKKVVILLLITVIAAMPLIFGACGSVSQLDMLSNPYVSGDSGAEVFTYEIKHDGNDAGTMTLTFKVIKGQDMTIADPTAESKERTVSSFTGTQLTMSYKMNELFHNDEGESVVLYTNAYKPVYSYKKLCVTTTEDGKLVTTKKEMVVEYKDKYAYTYFYENDAFKANSEQKIKNTIYFDNEMIYAVVRASNITESSYSMSFASPNASTSTLETITISKVDAYNLKVPAFQPDKVAAQEEQSNDQEEAAAAEEEQAETTQSTEETPETVVSTAAYLFRVAISNPYASSYTILLAKDSVTVKNSIMNVKNVKKPILQIGEGKFVYTLSKIEII